MLTQFRQFLLDRLVLRPTRAAVAPHTQRRSEVQLSQYSIEFFVQKNFDEAVKPDLLILKFPGTAGRAERSSPFPSDHFEDLNVEIWTWNPPGYGKSEGRARLAEIAKTAAEFCKYAEGNGGKNSVLWLMGNSLGCLPALHIASKMDKASNVGLILRNPPPLISVVKNVAKRYPLGWCINPVADSLCDSMNAMLSAPHCHFPALFLQSELDTLVPPHLQDEIIEAYLGEKRTVVLEAIGHDGTLATNHQMQVLDKLRWLWSLTKQTR